MLVYFLVMFTSKLLTIPILICKTCRKIRLIINIIKFFPIFCISSCLTSLFRVFIYLSVYYIWDLIIAYFVCHVWTLIPSFIFSPSNPIFIVSNPFNSISCFFFLENHLMLAFLKLILVKFHNCHRYDINELNNFSDILLFLKT